MTTEVEQVYHLLVRLVATQERLVTVIDRLTQAPVGGADQRADHPLPGRPVLRVVR